MDGNALMLSWQPPLPEERNGVIISYTLFCGGPGIKLNAVTQFTLYLYEFIPNAEITCRIAASTAAGEGPSTDEQTVIPGGTYLNNYYVYCLLIEENKLLYLSRF